MKAVSLRRLGAAIVVAFFATTLAAPAEAAGLGPDSATKSSASSATTLVTASTESRVSTTAVEYGIVAGRVVSQDGDGIVDVWVQLLHDGNWVADTATDPRGRYLFNHIESGPGYTARFTFPSGQVLWFDGADNDSDATAFTVDPNATTTVNMTRPPVGHLTIKTIDAVTARPIAGYCFAHQEGPVQFTTTCTDADGRAKIRNLTVGNYSGSGYDPHETYVNGTFDTVAVTEGNTTTVRVRLEKSVSLHVDFQDATTGVPVDGACVALADPVRNDIEGGGFCGAQIDLKNLFPRERFRLFVAPYDHQHGAQWVSTTGGGTGDPALAKIYAPEAGAHVTVTVKLDGAGTVSGVITDAETSAGVPDVCPSPTAPAGSYGPNMTADCTGNGEYLIRDLGPYQWKIAFPDYSGTHAWVWSGGEANRASAAAVQVTAGATTTVNVSLPQTGSISGTVTAPTGTCLECVLVFARDAATGDNAAIYSSVRPDGSFTLNGFNTQDVRLFYSLSNVVTEFPTQVHTTTGAAITGVTITIP